MEGPHAYLLFLCVCVCVCVCVCETPAFPIHSVILCVSCSVVSDSATPWTVIHQDPLSLAILQATILEWVAITFSLTQGWNPGLLHYRQIDSLQSEPPEWNHNAARGPIDRRSPRLETHTCCLREMQRQAHLATSVAPH